MTTNRIPRIAEHRRQHYSPDDCRPTPGWTLIGVGLMLASAAIAVTMIVVSLRWLMSGPDDLAVGQQQIDQAQQLDADDRKFRRIDEIIARHHKNIAREGQ